MLRKLALDDIAESEHVGAGRSAASSRTAPSIEDTESTVDLGLHGWTLFNYPERLSYSATRRTSARSASSASAGRTAACSSSSSCGGTLRAAAARAECGLGEIVPADQLHGLDRLGERQPDPAPRPPVHEQPAHPLVLVAAVPYFVAMAIDLRCGYKRTTSPRVYAFNLLLLPVNIAGTLKSIEQAISGTEDFRWRERRRCATARWLRCTFVVAPLRHRPLLSAYTAYRLRGQRPVEQRRLRSIQRHPDDVRDRRLHRHPKFDRRHLDATSSPGCASRRAYAPAPSRSARRPPRARPAVADWELVLYLGFADRRRAPRDAAEVTAAPEPPPGRESAPKRNGSITGLPHRHGVASYGLEVIGETD